MGDPLHQDTTGRGIANPVAAPRESEHLNVLPCLDEIVDYRERVREVHVVVAGPMRNEQFALKLAGIFHRRRVLVAFLVFLRTHGRDRPNRDYQLKK